MQALYLEAGLAEDVLQQVAKPVRQADDNHLLLPDMLWLRVGEVRRESDQLEALRGYFYLKKTDSKKENSSLSKGQNVDRYVSLRIR